MKSTEKFLLLIDDSKEDAMVIRRIVSKSKFSLGFQWFSDPEEALEQLTSGLSEDCFLILLDIKMPKLTGLELLESLHEREVLTHQPPIIVYSSSGLNRDREVVARYEGVRYKIKPEGYLEGKAWLNSELESILT